MLARRQSSEKTQQTGYIFIATSLNHAQTREKHTSRHRVYKTWTEKEKTKKQTNKIKRKRVGLDFYLLYVFWNVKDSGRRFRSFHSDLSSSFWCIMFFIFKIVNERGRTDIPNSWGHGTFVCVLNLEEFGSDEQSSRRRILCKRRGGWLVTGSRLWCRAEDLDGIPPSQPHSSIHFFLVLFFISIERRETETKENRKKNWTEAIFLPFFLRLHSQLAKRATGL